MNFELKDFFQKEYKNLIGSVNRSYPTYKSLIYRFKKGVRMDDAPSNKPATIADKGFDHWLVNTGETVNKGIIGKAFKNGFIVSASSKRHSGRFIYMGVPGGHKGQKRGVRRPRTEKRILKRRNAPTYRQIFLWHNTANGAYSGIFRQFPVGSKFFDRLKKRLVQEVGNEYKKTIEVK